MIGQLTSALAMAALTALLAPSSLSAQVTFQRTYGGTDNDYGYLVRRTADSGYAIVGHTLSFGAGGTDVYLVKTDAEGDTMWTRTFGGSDNDYGWSVRQTTDGGYIVAGLTFSFGKPGGDAYLIKTDSVGDTQWTRTYGGSGDDRYLSVEQTGDGGFVLVGKFGTVADSDDVYLVRTDSLGETLWTRTYGGGSTDCAWSVQQTRSGGYVIAGNTNSFGAGGLDVYLLRTNAGGDTLWTKTFGGAGIDGGYSVQQTTDGSYIVAGETQSFGAGNRDVYVIKTDSFGETLWTRTFGGTANDDGCSIQQTPDYGYIIAGSTASYGAGDIDVYLVKTDADGDSLWTRTYGGRDWDISKSVLPTADGGYVIAGHTESFGAGLIDMYLVKTDSLGRAVAVAEPTAGTTLTPAVSLSCEPNPFSGVTRIRFKPPASVSTPLTLRVYDCQGRLVHSVFGIRTSSLSLALGALPSGAYFLRCDIAAEHATTRVVLQR